MHRTPRATSPVRIATVLAISIFAIPNAFPQQVTDSRGVEEAARRAQYQEKLQKVANDKAGYASAIVRRWEDSAKASGRWDANYAADLYGALMTLQPDNLIVVGDAPTFKAMMSALATGRPVPAGPVPDSQNQTSLPDALGDTIDDLVYTPVTPCRIVDTRNAGGVISAGTTRDFDVDGSSFTGQGGSAGSCGIPYGVARAVAMTITAVQPAVKGYFTAWAAFTPQPASSVLNYTAGQNVANTTIVPVFPGAGNDFSLYSYQTSHAVIDVVGYFAAPLATALDCITVTSAVAAVGVNSWTNIDATCPAGRTATGGGYDTTEGTGGYPGVWITSLPNGNGWRTWVDNQTTGNRSVQTYVRCCRVPGR